VALDDDYAVLGEWEGRAAAAHPERASDWVKSNQAHLLSGGQPLADVLRAFVAWMEQLRGEHTAYYVGWTCAADLAHLDAALRAHGLTPPFHYRHIELNSVLVGRLGLPWDYEHSAALRQLGMEPAAAHVALTDAREAAAVFQRVMQQPIPLAP
jgi:inhibitor of KinA sporulation pathway (predicted exonuclease)